MPSIKNNNSYRSIHLLLLLLTLPIFSFAAEISIIGDDYYNSPAVSIVGEITPGDYEKFVSVAKDVILSKEYRYFSVYLNSPGGDVFEAIKIGRLIRDLLAKTYAVGFVYLDPNSKLGIEEAQYYADHPEALEENKRREFIPIGEKIPSEFIGRCYSACVFIFYAGVERDSTTNGYFRDELNLIPVIGLHRPFYDEGYYSQLSPTEAKLAYKKLETTIANYLSEMGAPNEVIERMLKTASNDIEMVAHEDFKKLYERKEPFLEEWLLAKCKSWPDGEKLLTDEDHKYFIHINDEKRQHARSVINDPDRYVDVLQSYFPVGADIDRYTRASNILHRNGQRIRDCRKNSVHNHQIQWAISH